VPKKPIDTRPCMTRGYGYWRPWGRSRCAIRHRIFRSELPRVVQQRVPRVPTCKLVDDGEKTMATKRALMVLKASQRPNWGLYYSPTLVKKSCVISHQVCNSNSNLDDQKIGSIPSINRATLEYTAGHSAAASFNPINIIASAASWLSLSHVSCTYQVPRFGRPKAMLATAQLVMEKGRLEIRWRPYRRLPKESALRLSDGGKAGRLASY
jgi:hypothetical protein